MARIVVGVDGSEASRAALDEALRQARCREAELDAIAVWHADYGGVEYGMELAIPREDVEASVRNMLGGLVAGADTAGITVNQITAEGDPASTLLDAAKGADLLVIGTRGRGGLLGLVLGSVSYKCISHSSCPVLVVPGSER